MEIVFDEIVPQYAIQLMQDVFGNYVRAFRAPRLLTGWRLSGAGIHRWFRRCSSTARQRRRLVS